MRMARHEDKERPAAKGVPELDSSSHIEHTCEPDADAQPTQADIEHMLTEWAEVGRAILVRRKQGHEAIQDKE